MKNTKQIAVISVMFVAVQFLAIAFMHFVLNTSYQAFENPDDPLIAVYYVVLLLAFTGIFLILVKFDLDKVIKAIFFVSIGFVLFFVVTALLTLFIADETLTLVAGIIISALAIVAAWRYPEWYVIDAIGLPMAVGIVALLGLSLGIVPVLLLLSFLAIYDFISVYKTKHMLTLAEGVGDMRLPLLLVIPKKLHYSYLDEKLDLKSAKGEKKEREAFLIGLGDMIIPGLLASSAFWFINSDILVFGIPSYLTVAICTIAGAVIGLVLLMRIVVKGNPQAGLPLLNGGAIAGFFISYILIFGFNFSYIL
jgi:presenilin-like A22 family membrane protease